MQESTSTASVEGVAAYVGIDWADQKHGVALRSASEPAKVEYRLIANEPEPLMDWLSELQQRFGAKGKVLICLEQSRGALIYHLMGYSVLGTLSDQSRSGGQFSGDLQSQRGQR
jgi:hypothetical protein